MVGLDKAIVVIFVTRREECGLDMDCVSTHPTAATLLRAGCSWQTSVDEGRTAASGLDEILIQHGVSDLGRKRQGSENHVD